MPSTEAGRGLVKKRRYHYDFFLLFKRDYTTRSDIAEFFKDNALFLPDEVGLDILLSCLC